MQDREKFLALEKRLAASERANRRWKGLGLLGACSLAVVLGTGWTPDKKAPQPMEVDGQLVVKSSGKIVARLGSVNGAGTLQIFGPSQNGTETPRAALTLENDSGVLHINAGNEKAMLRVGITPDKGGQITTKGNAGKDGEFPKY